MPDIIPHKVLFHPYVTEKTMFQMEDDNKLEFVVKRDATKAEIKSAFEELFEVKVESVNIKNTRHGKRAVIKLTDDYSAEDVGMRIGIF
ncbi:MAG: 50S ribosomal protein L23 [Methanomassiliicoccales archaeon]|nr:MAG: 50S ribosomal protein L23 [Methanomassiliicoccales archaeon]